MDHSANSASTFHKLADLYQKKFMDVAIYDDSYRAFCDLLPPGRARVLDAACGPGNIARFLITQRPDLDLMGIDLAPRMVELARQAIPSAQFVVHDCRHLLKLQRRFDGIICAFGLPYLAPEEVTTFIAAAYESLAPGGILYLSTILGDSEHSGFQPCSTGDLVFLNYYSEPDLTRLMELCGFTLVKKNQMPSPAGAIKATTDLIVLAKKK